MPRDRPGGPRRSPEEDQPRTTKVATFPLRLPVSLKAALETIRDGDETKLNRTAVTFAFDGEDAILVDYHDYHGR